MITVIGPRDKKPSNAINTTSSSPNWSKGLSPFFLGPCMLYDNIVSQNMENAWQYSKVYADQVDSNGNPTDLYWQWAQEGWKRHRADRYPRGKGAVPLYSLWKGQYLDYINARKEIYLPLYAHCVQKTESFQQLKELYQKEGSVTLFDYDGYNHHLLSLTLEQVLNNPHRKMGHAFVLAMLLDNHMLIHKLLK